MTSARPSDASSPADSSNPAILSTSSPQPRHTRSRTSGNRTHATNMRSARPSQPKNAQQEAGKEDLDPDDQQRGRDHGETFVSERAKTVRDPAREDHRTHHNTDQHEGSAQQ